MGGTTSQQSQTKALNKQKKQEIENFFVSVTAGYLQGITEAVQKNPHFTKLHQKSLTPLYTACLKGHLPAVRELIKLDPEIVNFTDGGNLDPPLCGAIASGNVDIISYLLDHNADPNVKKDVGEYPLIYSFQNYRNNEIIKMLIDHKANLTVSSITNDNVVSIAVSYLSSNQDIIKYIIKQKGDVNPTTGQLPLFLACSQNFTLVKTLLKYKANCNTKNANGYTPLHAAAMSNAPINVFESLFQHGADPNILDPNNSTPLLWHVQNYGYTMTKEIVDMYAKNGTQFHQRNNQGVSAISMALINCPDIAVHLIPYGLPEPPPNQRPYLHQALFSGSLPLIEKLIQTGVDLETPDPTNSQYKPIHTAINSYREEFVRLLVARKANVNSVTLQGDTPLHLAGRSNLFVIVEILLTSGADFKAANNLGATPLSEAQGASYQNEAHKAIIRWVEGL